MTSDLADLSRQWLEAKARETAATEDRRKVEDQIKAIARISESLDGTETLEPAGFTIKVVGRIERNVNSEKLQELAAEAGLTDHLSSLFRWKPELNVSAWKGADQSITNPLAAAITVKAGRPSFSIKPIKE